MSGTGPSRTGADRQLDLREFAVSLDPPLGTAEGTLTDRRGWLVALRRDGETLGVGEATPLAGWTETHAACEDALTGRSETTGRSGPTTADATRGAVPPTERPAARHGVTLALADALARRRGESLAELLARVEPPERVPVNATLGDADAESAVETARAAVAAGYETLKLKIGAREPEVDCDRVRRVAAAVPEAVTIRVDANGAYDRETAHAVLSTLDGLVEYVEQPVSADDVSGLARLRGVGAPIAADESVARVGAQAVLAAGAADVLVCKPMALGGPYRTLAVARAAAAAGVTPVVTTTIDAVIARTGAVHVAAACPGELAHGLATGDRLVSEPDRGDGVPLSDPVAVDSDSTADTTSASDATSTADASVVRDGTVSVPDGPGLAGDALDWWCRGSSSATDSLDW